VVGVIPHVDPVLKCVLVVWRGRDLNSRPFFDGVATRARSHCNPTPARGTRHCQSPRISPHGKAVVWMSLRRLLRACRHCSSWRPNCTACAARFGVGRP